MINYSSYRDSCVQWVGDIPSHWNMYPIKHLFSERNEKNDCNNTDYLSIVKDKGIIPYSEKGNVGNKTSDRPENYKMVHIDDIVINPMNVTIGSVGKSNYNGCLSSVYIVLEPKDIIDSSYYDYVYSIKSFQKSLKRISYGLMEIRESLNKIEFYVERLPLPPLYEQQKIVSYLDYKTKKIDELVVITEKKIELLKEQRTSLINHCVTKGLNPNVEMKDSGIEWIGQIPSHWDIKRVKYLLDDDNGIKIGPFGSSLKLDTLTDTGIKIYGQENVIKDNFQLGHRYLPIERFEQEFTQYEIFDGDVLVTMMGTTGKSKVFRDSYSRGILDSHLLRLRFNESLFSGYLFSILLEQSDYIIQQIKLSSKGSIMEGLNSSIIKELKILIQSLEEQKTIIEYLGETILKIDSTIEKETQRIELLKEYRQSLISEVVTGKIDVRDWKNDSKELS